MTPAVLSPGDTVDVTIDTLGARGDGIARHDGTRLFVAYAAPGDRVRVRIDSGDKDGLRATILERLSDGPGRQGPLCRHFGDCGGCVAQHLNDTIYEPWKTAAVRDALTHRGLDPTVVRPLHRLAPGTRRRARLKARRTESGVLLGFFAPASHRVIDLTECPVMVPPLVRLLAPLRAALGDLLALNGTGDAAMTASETGIDLVLGMGRAPGRAQIAHAVALAEAADLARVSFRQTGGGHGADAPAEPVAQRRPVQVRFGEIAVDLPPDAFLQPTADGERFLADAVAAAVGGAMRIVDLYSGCGAFALRVLAAGARVRAIDSAADHVRALEAAARRSGLGAQLNAETRDLSRRPLAGEELVAVGAVVLDPPRPGAPQQAKALAASGVPVVAYVSCNPASFARDARTLVDGGYGLESVQPLDQFVFSPHVELVGVFRKERKRRR